MQMLSALFGLLTTAAHAASTLDYGGMYDRICTTLPFCDRQEHFFAQIGMAAINVILPITGFAAVGSLGVAAVKIVSGGEEGFSTGKKIIMTTMLGVFLALGAYGIMVYLNNQVVSDATH